MLLETSNVTDKTSVRKTFATPPLTAIYMYIYTSYQRNVCHPANPLRKIFILATLTGIMLKDIHLANANVCHPAYPLRKIFILTTLTAPREEPRLNTHID